MDFGEFFANIITSMPRNTHAPPEPNHYLPTVEAMRKYPPVQALVRVCTKQFRVPGTNLDLDVGTAVLIPVYAIHHDPQYYPEPDTFNPDRFAKDSDGGGGDNGRPAGVYLPFGDGPRICIGMFFKH